MGATTGDEKGCFILNENPKTSRNIAAENELDLIRLLNMLAVQWKIILCVTGTFTMGALLYVLLTPPVYQADALIQVEQKQGQALLSRLSSILPNNTPDVASEIELLKSRMILGKTVDDLNLRTQTEQIYFPVAGRAWSGLKGEAPGKITVRELSLPLADSKNAMVVLTVKENGFYHLQGAQLSLEGRVGERLEKQGISVEVGDIQAVPGTMFRLWDVTRLEAISALQRRLNVFIQGKESGMLSLNMTGTNPDELTRILDAMMNNYLQQNIDRQAARDAKSLAFLQHQLPKVRDELDVAESKLNIYRKQQDSVDLNLEAKSVLEQMVNVDNQLNTLTFREAEISQLYKKNHPAYRALLDKRQTLMQEKLKLNSRISTMPSTQQEVLRLSRDVETGRDIYLQLLSRQQELSIARSSSVGNVRIVDPAVAWPSPVKPKKSLIVLLGMISGMMVSVGWGVVRITLRQRIESSEELEDLGVPVLATVPVSEWLEKIHRRQQIQSIAKLFKLGSLPRFFLAVEAPADVSIEAVRGLRTALHFSMEDAPNRVLMISGATMGCGKTFISSSLAAVVAQSGQRVLFIDADMRRGYTHILFNAESRGGLSDVLSGKSTVTESIQRCREGQFDVLTRGTLPSGPA